MPIKTAETPTIKPDEIIRDKGFAKRLAQACEENRNCPTEGRGKQKWLHDRLAEQHDLVFSAETVRKWFKGVMKPRMHAWSAIATVLEVDEQWLFRGIDQEETPTEKKKRNAVADGAVNYVAGLIQLAGGNIAFPETEGDDQPDLFAIVKGKQHAIEIIHMPADKAGTFRVRAPVKAENKVVIVVTNGDAPTHFTLLRLTTELIAKNGKGRGGYVDLAIEKVGSNFVSGEDSVPQIVDLTNLDGVTPKKPTKAPSK